MNFAKTVDRNFSTKKEVLRSKQMSETNKRKKAFISSHDFSIDVTPSGKCTLKTKKR